MTDKVSKRVIKSAVRIVGLLTISCLLLAPAGCAGKPEGPEEDFSFMEQYEDDPSSSVESSAPTEHTTIRFLFPGYTPRNWENVKAEIEKRTRDTLNITLDFKWKEQYMYINDVKTLQASNQEFDAFILASPDIMSPDFTKLARAGILKEITNIFPQSAPGLYKKYTNEELEYASVDSKLYAVPSLFVTAFCPGIMANDSLLERYKIDDITDFEQYETFLKTVKENKPDDIPGVDTSTFIATLPATYGYAIADQRNMLVYKWDDPEMKLMAWERTPEFYDTVNMYIDWFKKGYLKAAASGDDYFKASSVMLGSSVAPPSKETEIVSTSNANGKTLVTEPMRICRLYPERTVQRDNPMGNFSVNGSFVFTKESKNTEMVLRFLEWVQLDRENYNLVVNGIEGEDYVINDGKPELPNGMNSLSSSYMDWGGHWAFRNIEYETAENKVQPLMEYLKNHTKYPPHGVFYPEYGALEQVAEMRSRGLQEFSSMLSQGQIKSLDELEKLINRMEDIGTDELVAAAQSQLTKK